MRDWRDVSSHACPTVTRVSRLSRRDGTVAVIRRLPVGRIQGETRMSIATLRGHLLIHVSALGLVAGLLAVGPAKAHDDRDNANTDTYMAGDFHNHTTCTDGTVSIETMITKSIKTFDLEWMASADHGGSGTRDCRIDDPEGDSSKTGSGALWEQTIGAAALKGDVLLSTANTPDTLPHRAMWRWQMIEEIVFPEVARLSKQLRNPMLYAGLE